VELRLPGRVECVEGSEHGPVVAPEHLDPMLRGIVPKDELPVLGTDVGRLRSEQFDDPRLGAPRGGGGTPGRRRDDLTAWVHDPPHEQDAPGHVVVDHEQERMVGDE